MKKLLLEADRCLLCKNPRCKNNCPISTEIPEVIQMFKENKIMEAGKVLFDNNPLSSVCAIVCPHEDQCKGNCIRGIKSEPVSFCEIEEYISNEYLYNLKFEDIEKKDESIAIIGAGPAGITLSIILARRGYKVTLFDAHEKIGGVLRYGIPEYRLPNSIIDRYGNMPKEIEKLLDIARIRNMCRAKNIIKVSQKTDKVIFYFYEKTFDFAVVDKLLKKYGMRIKFSPAKNPYITYKLKNINDILKEIKEFLGDI